MLDYSNLRLRGFIVAKIRKVHDGQYAVLEWLDGKETWYHKDIFKHMDDGHIDMLFEELKPKTDEDAMGIVRMFFDGVKERLEPYPHKWELPIV